MTKRVRQIANQMEQKLSDSVKFSRVKGKSILTAIQRWPKSPFTIHIFGFQAMGNPSGTSTQLSVALLIANFKDYVPKYFQIHSMQIITPRALPAPIQQGNETAARYSVLADFGFTLFGKELLGTSTSHDILSKPSRWRNSVGYPGCQTEHFGYRGQSTTCWVYITPLYPKTAILLDVHMARWGFQRALTHRELMLSDPVYRQEQNLRVARLPSQFADTDLKKEREEVKQDLPIKPPSSFVQEDDVSIWRKGEM